MSRLKILAFELLLRRGLLFTCHTQVFYYVRDYQRLSPAQEKYDATSWTSSQLETCQSSLKLAKVILVQVSMPLPHL